MTRPRRRIERRMGRANAPRLGRRAARFVVVSGMSGAGKSQAIRALEDLGYFCVDNLPIALIPTFADLALSEQFGRAAVVVDIREGRALSRFPAMYRRLKQQSPHAVRLIFLDAGDAALLRRFSETRRPHPLAARRSVAEAIREERRVLEPLQHLADQTLDTSTLNPHELRRRILESTAGSGTAAPMIISIVSFGFRRGVPTDADMVLDVRFLPNPHFVTTLRPLSGKNARVARYVLRSPAAARFLRHTSTLLRFLVPQFIAEGKTYLTLAIGCTGGQHRSVAMAEVLGRRLRRMKGVDVRVTHRDVSET